MAKWLVTKAEQAVCQGLPGVANLFYCSQNQLRVALWGAEVSGGEAGGQMGKHHLWVSDHALPTLSVRLYRWKPVPKDVHPQLRK